MHVGFLDRFAEVFTVLYDYLFHAYILIFFFCIFYRQDDAFNIFELYVNHINLFIKRSFHKDNNSTV